MQNAAPFIPRKTLEELSQPHQAGERHAALFKIAIPLLGNGMHPDAVFAQLRSSFDDEKTDREIRDVIEWCVAKNPTPSTPTNGMPARGPMRFSPAPMRSEEPEPKLTAEQLAAHVTEGEDFDESYWREKSPIDLPEDFRNDAALLLSHLYGPEETVNILVDYTVNEKGKANPQGSGKTMTRAEWIAWFADKGAPATKAGAWIRPNPCKIEGSGKSGAICDADIVSHRFLMIESDSLPLETQFALYAKLPLPIAAIILSGGDSAHAWLKIDCKTQEEYTAKVAEFYTVAEKLGFDKANKNSSRLSRLPGVVRKIGATPPGHQRLVYLNPKPPAYEFAKLKAAATPVLGLIRADALQDRFRLYMAPKKAAFTLDFLAGKTPDDGFYFRNGEVTVWSGMTSHGKSTMLATLMLKLIIEATPFFICSLEYKPEKMCEMLASITCRRKVSADEGVEFLQMAGMMFSFADMYGEIAPERLIALLRAAHAKHGATHFFIDSLMRVKGLHEDYPRQGQLLNELQAIAKETNGHVHLVAHPRKIDEAARARKMDVMGSSLIVNNADNVVTMRRNIDKKELLERGELTPELDAAMHDAEFTVEKQRESGWEGLIKLRFNRITKIFEKFVPPENPPEIPRSHARKSHSSQQPRRHWQERQ